MKTNYSKMDDERIAQLRLERFRTGPPVGGNGELSREFRKRFPRMEDKATNVILTPKPPPWMTDDAPSFLEQAPDWMVSSAKKKGKKLSMFADE